MRFPVDCHLRAVLIAAPMWMTGCAKSAALAHPDSRPAIYDVAVASASGDRRISSLYALQMMPDAVDPSIRTVWTIHSEGTWEDGGNAMAFNSEAPRPSDPWPLTLQHTIATVPARISFTGTGAPEQVLDQPKWSQAVHDTVLALNLPEQALSTAGQLTDAQGVIRDLARNFPGTPLPGIWERDERIAGVDARRQETCVAEVQGARAIWACQGKILGPTEGSARLVDGTSHTQMVVDRRGLVLLEADYLGTLVLVGPNDEHLGDQAIGGRRLVERR
jgi:hypothetical protein